MRRSLIGLGLAICSVASLAIVFRESETTRRTSERAQGPASRTPTHAASGSSDASAEARSGAPTESDDRASAAEASALRIAFIEARQAESRGDASYRVTARGGRLEASNAAQHYEVVHRADRVEIIPEHGGPRLALATTRIGCGDAPSTMRVGAVEPSRDDPRRVERTHETGLVSAREWYLNGGAGLEQGFDIASATCGADPLVIEVALTGMAPSIVDGRIILSDGAGRERLAYGDLFAKDAEGHVLPARLSLAGATARLEVDTEGARFPVVVDPLLVNLEATLAPDSPGYGVPGGQAAYDVAISGSLAAITSPTDVYGGSVYIFLRSGTSWSLEQRITNPAYVPGSGVTNGGFGASVALSGNTLAIGVEDFTDDGIDVYYGYGSISVYTRALGVWTSQATLTRGTAQSQSVQQGFGTAVSLDGDVLAAGAYGETSVQGAVYVWRRISNIWAAATRITAQVAQSGASFGKDVAVEGTLLVVGEPGRTVALKSSAGSAVLYQWDGTTWVSKVGMFASDALAQDRFGEAVDVDAVNNRILVGAPSDDTSVTDGGSAYVFVYNGLTVSQEAQFIPTGASTMSQQCGADVALAGSLALIGCPFELLGGVQSGAAHVFTRSTGAWADGGSRVPPGALAYEQVGRGVAIDGTLGVVGAPGWDEVGRADQGRAAVYSGASQTFEAVLSPGRSAYDDRFGQSVSVSGDTVVVGTPNHDIAGAEVSGAVYVFRRTVAGTYVLEAKLLSPASSSERFGDTVDIDGDTLVVGGPYRAFGATGAAGAAYVFQRTGMSWGAPVVLSAPTPTAGSLFGDAVAISGNYIVVSEPYYDLAPVLNIGRVHFFERNGAAWPTTGSSSPSAAAANDFVGSAVDISGTTAVVGAPETKSGINASHGAVYVFRRNAGTGSWIEQTPRLTGLSSTANVRFGYSVTMRGTTLLVGAPGDVSSRGSVYTYTDTGGAFNPPGTIAPGTPAPVEQFGTSVSYDGSLLAVGSVGRARYFYGSGFSFSEQGTILPPGSFGASSEFGVAIATTPGKVVVGAPMMSEGHTPYEGRANVYSVTGFQGDGCSTNSQCGSGFCVDGVCCDTSCGLGNTSDCMACSAAAGASTNGVCGAIAAAALYTCRAADASGCDAAEVCNGVGTTCPADAKATDGSPCGASPSGICDAQDTCLTGACSLKFASNTTACSSASCSAGTATPSALCTGSSTTCPTATPTSCGAYACGATSCLATCSSDTQCGAAYYCNGASQCVAKLVDGQSCMSANQCQSAMCAGVCGGDVDECMLNTDNCSANATCTNTVGSFTCACLTGYTGNGVTCSDVNECLTNNGGCAAAAVCTNTPGSRTCACPLGYTGDGFTCTDVNECLTSNGGCSTSPMVTCTNTAGSRTCAACPSGYAGDGTTCTDVDECLSGNGGCSTSPLVSCTNTVGSRICGGCPAGYSGNGTVCTDVDECTLATDNCSVNATCTNTAGSFSCTCNGGYSGSGQSCSDINECTLATDNCSANGTCSNVPGTFTCSCNTGYTGNGVTCTDVNECLTSNGGCSTSPMVACTNTPGSRTCAACPTGYSGNGSTCTNVNECTAATDTCTSLQACTDTVGSFTCTMCSADATVQSSGGTESCVCNVGFGGDGQTCAANACNPACGTGAVCNGTVTFTCACPTGYGGDPLVACTDQNECQLGTDTCSVDAACTNTTGWYTCACNAGFTGNGTTCTDVDECLAATDDCAVHATCTNVPGSFECNCNTGYTGNGVVCVPAGMDAGIEYDAGTTDAGSDAGEEGDAGALDDGGTDASTTPPTLRSRPGTGLCSTSPGHGGTGNGNGALAALVGLALAFGLARRTRAGARARSTFRHLARLVAFAGLVGLLAEAPTAHAQHLDESVARAQFQLGQAYLNQGRFHEAAVAFELAYAASDRAELLYNAYVAYRDAQEMENAANALRRFLAADPSANTPLMQSRLAAIESQLAERRAAADSAERARLAEERAAAVEAARVAEASAAESAGTPAVATAPEEQGGGNGLAFGLIGGGGGLALAGMLVGGLGASSQAGRLDGHCGASAGLASGQCLDDATVSDVEGKTTLFRVVGWSSLALGVSAAGVGTVLLLTGGDDEDDAPAVSAAPSCGRDGCSITVFGRF